MNEIPQLASAMLTVVFTVGLLIAGQLYTDYRAAKFPIAPVLAMNMRR